ncbi:DsbA family protein [Gordonia jinhuaensis]|uniref:Thioredoxin domain-containing protein n=1 Tax=Gordonia jinhuaensis TaxID=1517702 RepID=A0A916TF90_9ACTN|nr:thioredoxin domain-containing protein [Gordonia jinhuaensis]GGB42231.1 hypothetical protein GCM10011489_32200 [Gordonia jinhuaensis]
MALTEPVGPDDHVQGADDAPLTIVEYGDYQCSYCGQAYPIIKDLQREYGDQIRFCFRNFPIPEIHDQALSAAQTAEYAARGGRFWAAHDALYEHQDRLGNDYYTALVGELGLDESGLSTALDSDEFIGDIQHDINTGLRSGVNGTPAFFVNDEFFPGPFTDLPRLVAALVRG